MCASNKSFGLTDEEHQFLLDDINQAIEDANKKYGYDDSEYIGEDGNYYPFSDNDKPKNIGHKTLIPKSKTKRRRKRRPSIEQVAIARGIIRVIPLPLPLAPLEIPSDNMEANH
jgi:hypothetical protein